MDLISEYLAKRTISGKLFEDIPEKNTSLIVIIPAYDEAGISYTLDSLNDCDRPPCSVEVMVLVNAPRQAGRDQLQQNTNTIRELKAWKEQNRDSLFKLLYFDAGPRKETDWGVGMARKMIMDEAVRRFEYLNNHEGLIVSLDADCKVSANYLADLYDKLYLDKTKKACSIYFEHPLEGDKHTSVYEAVAKYELHLRYYYQGLKYCGFPWVFQTVGSCLAVKTYAYVRSGGMNRKKGAEDFYFIQKILPYGGYFYLNSTVVYPEARISDRVPFGTGPVVAKMIERPDKNYYTYNPAGFDKLKDLFVNMGMLYSADDALIRNVHNRLDLSLQHFVDESAWLARINEIKKNTSSYRSFHKRFFSWFNMFMIVKYLNFSHSQGYLERIPVEDAAAAMLERMDLSREAVEGDDLLHTYRDLEKAD